MAMCVRTDISGRGEAEVNGLEGCSETQPSLSLPFLLAGEKRLILRRVHQLIDFHGIGEINHYHPALTVGITVYDLGMILEIGIHLDDRSADRRVNGGSGLCRFDFTNLLSGLYRRPDL